MKPDQSAESTSVRTRRAIVQHLKQEGALGQAEQPVIEDIQTTMPVEILVVGSVCPAQLSLRNLWL